MNRYMRTGLVICLAAGLLGCSGQEEQGEPAPAVASYEVATGEEEYLACVDMNMVMQTLAVNGQQTGVPFALSCLGNNLTAEEWILLESDKGLCYRGTVTDGGTVHAGVELYKESEPEEGIVYELQVYQDGGIPVSVNGITFGSSYEQVVAAFGEPSSENGKNTDVQNVYYENCSSEFLVFTLEDGAVSSIIIHYLPPELR